MADFLKELPRIFRERYLNTHETYLKSIADVIAHLYPSRGDDDRPKCERIVGRLLQAGPFQEGMVDKDFESIYFRNLRNAWYNECALDEPRDLNEKLKFAPWKIIQSYYAIFSGIAALVRCFHHSEDRLRQIATLNIFGVEFLRNRKRKSFFLIPFNFHLDQNGAFDPSLEDTVGWDYASQYHIPNIRKCLESVHKPGRMTSILHYLKTLREWAQYEDAYLFFRLYGESPKRNLDFSLSEMTFGYLTLVEFFFIKLFGWETLELQYETFRREVRQNLKVEPLKVESRFDVYSRYLKDRT